MPESESWIVNIRPPTRPLASSTRTVLPACVSSRAAIRPAAPAPMTIASVIPRETSMTAMHSAGTRAREPPDAKPEEPEGHAVEQTGDAVDGVVRDHTRQQASGCEVEQQRDSKGDVARADHVARILKVTDRHGVDLRIQSLRM